MTLQQVTDWLERLELGQYAEAFRDNHIDGATLRGLDDAELEQLGVASLGHRKRLRAAIAALSDPIPPGPLADLIPRLPTPLALPLAEYLKETEPKLKLWDACDAVEDLLRLLVFLGVGELCRLRGELPADLRRDLYQVIELPTLGNWWRMAQQVAPHIARPVAGPESADTALPEFPSAVAQILAPVLDGPAGPRTVERSFLTLRIQLAHGGVTHRQAARLLQHWQAPFEALWPALAWLADLHLTVRTATGYGCLRGPDTLPAPLTPPPSAAIDPAFAAQDAVVALRGERVIPLWPLALFGIPRHPEHGTDPADPPLPQVYVRRGQVNLHYRPLGETGIVQSESDQTATERFLALFRAPEPPRPKDRQGFSVQGFEDSFRKLAESLIGRTRERETLRSVLDATPSGVLWLDGRAGMGKSYLVADLAAEWIDRPPADTLVLGYQFRANDALRCAREPFLRFACERIEAALPPDERPQPDGDGQPPKPLERLKTLLARLAERAPDLTPGQPAGARRVLFLLDGLDEIAERDRRFVHDLPLGIQGPNLTWLCAGRPEQGLPEAFAAAGAVRVFPDGLQPMGADDIRAMLMERIGPLRKKLLRQDTEEGERVANPFIDKVARLSEGLPLYVKYVIDDIFDNKYRILDAGESLPPSLDAYHEELLRRLGIGDLHQVLTPLAATLAVAREPLSVPALADLLHRRGDLVPAGEPGIALVRKALGTIQTMLRAARTPEGNEGYVLYHHSLAQHMAGEKSESLHAVSSAQRFLASQAETVRSGPLAHYLFRRGIGHLLEVGRPDAALTLLIRFDYLMDRLRTLPDPDGVVGLGEDWRATLHLSPILDRATRLWEAFFREREHILRRGHARWPANKILLQLAVEHADDSPVTLAAERWLTNGHCDWTWFRNPQRVRHASPDPCLRVFEGHAGKISGALLFPDDRILTWSSDQTLRIWDYDTASNVATLAGHGGEIDGAQLLDGNRILSWSRDGTLRLWESEQGSAIAVLEGHTARVYGAQVVNGRYILSWSEDGTLRVWNAETASVLRVLGAHDQPVFYVEFLDDGRFISVSEGSKIVIWQNLFDTTPRVIVDRESIVRSFRVLAQDRIITYDWDARLRVFDINSGALLLSIETQHKGHLTNLVVLPNGNCVSLAEDGAARLWNPNTGDRLAILPGVGWNYGALALPEDHVLIWGIGSDLLIFHATTGELLSRLTGHKGQMWGAELLPQNRILSRNLDCTARIWDANTGTLLSILEGHTGTVGGTLVPKRGGIITWSADGTMRLWNSHVDARAESLIHHAGPASIQLIREDKLLSWTDWSARTWRRCTGEPLLSFAKAGSYPVVPPPVVLRNGTVILRTYLRSDLPHELWDATSEDAFAVLDRFKYTAIISGKLILGWSASGELSLWDSATGRRIAEFFGHTEEVRGAIVLDDERILTFSKDGTLRIWHTLSGELKATLVGHERSVVNAEKLNDGRILSWSHDIRLWDGRNGDSLAVLSGHTRWVLGAIVLEDGRIISWSQDRTIRVWDVERQVEIATLVGHSGEIGGAVLLPSGRVYSWSGEEGKVRVWNATTGENLFTYWAKTKEVGAILSPDQFLTWNQNLIGSGAEILEVRDTTTGRVKTTLALPDRSKISFRCMRDGSILTWGDWYICVWQAERVAPLIGPTRRDHLAWEQPELLHLVIDAESSTLCVGGTASWSYATLAGISCRTGTPPACWIGSCVTDVKQLFADGILTVSLQNGHVFCLQLHRGNQRITIADYEGSGTAPGEVEEAPPPDPTPRTP